MQKQEGEEEYTIPDMQRHDKQLSYQATGNMQQLQHDCGKCTRVYPGLPATGCSFSIPGVTVVVRRNGEMVRESLCYDIAEERRQLGPRQILLPNRKAR